jgi:hypothetical protein
MLIQMKDKQVSLVSVEEGRRRELCVALSREENIIAKYSSTLACLVLTNYS